MVTHGSQLLTQLKTPLEMMCFTWKTLQEGFLMGEKPISEDTVRDAIGRSFDTLESRLTRQGYSPQRLSECLNASVHEIRDFLRGRLPAVRAIEIEEELSQYGIAVGEL